MSNTKNKLLLICASFFSKLGDSLSNTKVVLPWMLSSLGAPSFFAGVLVPIRDSGSLIPQVVLSGWLQALARRKKLVAFSAAMQAMSMCGIAVTALLSSGLLAGLLITFFIIVFSSARGLSSLATKDVLGKTIAKQQRGRLMGWSATLAGGITILLGVALLFSLFASEHHFAEFVFAASVAWFASCLCYLFISEPKGETENTVSAFESVRNSWSLLIEDKAFRDFVIARSLIMSSALVAPYFIVMAQANSTEADIKILGGFLIIAGVASFASSYIWGKAADQNSRGLLRVCSLATAMICLMAVTVAVAAEDWQGNLSMGLFLLLSIVHQGVRLGRKTYIVDLAEGNDRTRYVATSNTAIGLLLLGTGIITAALSLVSLWIVFILFAVMSVLAFWRSSTLEAV